MNINQATSRTEANAIITMWVRYILFSEPNIFPCLPGPCEVFRPLKFETHLAWSAAGSHCISILLFLLPPFHKVGNSEKIKIKQIHYAIDQENVYQNQRGLNTKRSAIVFFLGLTKPPPSYDQASPYRRFSVS
jgi:hypothetical protein